MTIAYFPNDPLAPEPIRQIKPAPDRKAPLVGFNVANLPPEQVYPGDSKQYAFWAARESALAAINAFEACAGPLKGWQGKASLPSLALIPDAGVKLNAFYDRASISFFETPVAGKTLYTGASQDIAAHETGHAILDALRPDLWGVTMTEIAAFHEGFGDCIAVLTALADQATRVQLLKADPALAKGNFVEATGEALAAAVAIVRSPTHNAAKPRRAFNDYRWNFPASLPDDGGPDVLINEIHCLGQLVSGCFYRIVLGVFARTGGGEAGLWQSSKVAMWLLASAVLKTPVRPRFFQAVGRAMLAVDQAAYKGLNAKAIKDAYAHHGIDVSATTLLAPLAPLGPTAAGFAASGDKPVGAAGNRSVAAMLGAADGAKVSYRRVEFGDRAVAVASVPRAVDLGGLDPRLADAVAVAPQEAFVGENPGGGAAMLGSVDPGAGVDREVRDYVAALLRRDDIAFDGKASDGKPGGGAGYIASPDTKTHALRTGKDGVAQLQRIAFACGCKH